MTISPLTAAALSTNQIATTRALSALSRAGGTASLLSAASVAENAAASAVSRADISALGRLLSATSTFPSTRVAAQRVASNDSSATSVARLSAATQRTVDAYNAVQSSLATSLVNQQVTLLGTALPTTAVDYLRLQNALLLANSSGVSSALANIGITFQPGSFGQASLDLAALQKALADDPKGTAALLAQAVQVTGQLAADLVGAGTNTLGATTDLTTLNSLLPSAPYLVSNTASTATSQNALLDAALSGALAPALAPSTVASTVKVKTVPALAVVNTNATPAAAVATPATAAIAATPATTSATTTTATASTPTSNSASISTTSLDAQNTTTPLQADAVAQAIASNTASAVAAVYLSNGSFGAHAEGAIALWPDIHRAIQPVARVQAISRVTAIEAL